MVFRRPSRGSPHFVFVTGGLHHRLISTTPPASAINAVPRSDTRGVRLIFHTKEIYGRLGDPSLLGEKIFELFCDNFEREVLGGDGLHVCRPFLDNKRWSQQVSAIFLISAMERAKPQLAGSETIDRAIPPKQGTRQSKRDRPRLAPEQMVSVGGRSYAGDLPR